MSPAWGGHGLQADSEAARRNWWNAPKGDVYTVALEYVQAVDRLQAPLFDKFVKLEALYDTNPRTNLFNNDASVDGRVGGKIIENVIASNIDTVAASISATDVRARFETTDATWEQQRTAKHLEWYADGIAVMFDVGAKCRHGFKAGAALKGTGLTKVYIDEFDQIRVDSVMVDDIVVDELETRNGSPRQMHYRTLLDREDMKAQFPEYAKEIENAQTSTARNWRIWAGYRPVKQNELVVIESWRLPIGKKGKKGYQPGRHCIMVDGCDLLDEEWEKTFFPFAKIVWTQPARGWYGISLAERIAPIQRALNKRNWQIERTLDQSAAPTTFVQLADAKLAIQSTNRIGNIAVYKAAVPVTPSFPQVNAEIYADRERQKASAFEESGVSRMAAQSVKPAGLDSGVAMREYRDQTTQRFAMQEKAYEQFWLDTITLIIDCCKDLGKDAPVIDKKTKFGAKKIKWSDVDMGDIKIQIAAASTLSQTPAGRQQSIVEWAQAGIISQDEARRLMDHPDLERAMSIYTAALDDIESTLESIMEGHHVMPEPYQNLKIGVWRAQQQYLILRDDQAPEEILEGMRQWIVQAAYIQNPPAPPQPAMSPGPPMMPGQGPQLALPPGQPGMDPNMMAAPPPDVGGAAQGAFAPQAMQTIAAP